MHISYTTIVAEAYSVLWRLGISVDVVRPGDALDGYELVVMPSALLLGHSDAAILRSFVEQGGTLLGVAKTAHQDEWGAFYPVLGQPLGDVLGFAVNKDDGDRENLVVRWEDGQTANCLPHAECVELTTAVPFAFFEGAGLSGRAAGLVNEFGKASYLCLVASTTPR
ncbi:MAG: beta-galactosidase trimerization domain-containing protein [Capsulimonadaceae bacterium]|nr:beta-galactosidase trimerization domain-containing protein [Capsulimonadaceae bacterium]